MRGRLGCELCTQRVSVRSLQAKIEQPQLDLGREGAHVVAAAIQLITTE